jgi:hypothetical protein
MLNLPLGHRARGGSLDAQIDRAVREQRKQDAERHSATIGAFREKKGRVADLLSKIGDYRIMQLAKPLGSKKPKTARAALLRAASRNLDAWLATLEREQFPAGGCAACWAPLGQCSHSDSEWLGEQ